MQKLRIKVTFFLQFYVPLLYHNISKKKDGINQNNSIEFVVIFVTSHSLLFRLALAIL